MSLTRQILSYDSDDSDAAGKSSSEAVRTGRTRRAGLVAALVILIIAGLTAFFLTRAPTATTQTTSTSIFAGPDTIISSAVEIHPSGFALESSKPSVSTSGTHSGDWAVLGRSDGSVANVTAVVYASSNASRAYFDGLVASVRGLAGYTDITSDLSAFQQYGKCYGYGEDVDGIAVANGVCTKGNVLLQVHLVSSVPFSTLEVDLTSIMGTLYQSAT